LAPAPPPAGGPQVQRRPPGRSPPRRRPDPIRVATDGTPNACSLLYAAAWQAAKALGYRRLVTYTQKVLGFAISEAPMAANWSTGST